MLETPMESLNYICFIANGIMEKKEQSNAELSTDMSGLWQRNNEAIEGPINASHPFNTTMGKNSHVEVEHNSTNGK